MKRIWKIDAWIMAKHQWVADRVYSRLGLSPYELSAQTFGAVVLGNLAYWGIRFSLADQEPADAFSMVLALLGVVVPSLWFWLALAKHKQYARSKLSPPSSPLDDWFRVFFASPLVVIIPSGVIHLLNEPLVVLHTATFVVEVSAFYFFGCSAPTFIERKEKKTSPMFRLEDAIRATGGGQ